MINPTKVKYTSGPNCDGCPYRRWSYGFVPPQGMRFAYNEGNWDLYEPGPLFEQARYFFLGHRIGTWESLDGRVLVGKTGNAFNALVRKSSIRRSQCVLSNVVHCRPITWVKHLKCNGEGCAQCRSGMMPWKQSSGDFTNLDPMPPGQIRECWDRYVVDELAAFKGTDIVAMGKEAVLVFIGGNSKISSLRGNVYEHGELIECNRCEGKGSVSAGLKPCPTCKGKLVVNEYREAKTNAGCPSHKRKNPGKTKPSKTNEHCHQCWELFHRHHPWCPDCKGVGKASRGRKLCPDCHGAGRVAKEESNPFVSEKLRPGQLLFASYHPAYVNREPHMWTVVADDFQRIPELREELRVESSKVYNYSPTEADVREVLGSDEIALDYETTGLDADTGDVICLSASPRPLRSIVVGGYHPLVDELLRHPRIIGQNWMLFDAHWSWKKYGIDPPEHTFDTRNASHLLNPDTPNDLTYIVSKYAKPRMRGFWKTKNNYRDHIELVACTDTDGDYRAKEGMEVELKDLGLYSHFWNEVMPCAHLAYDMWKKGQRLDTDQVNNVHRKLSRTLDAGRLGLPDWGGTRTEGQHAKVRDYLYDTLQLPTQRHKKKGNVTADKTALDSLLSLIETNDKKLDGISESNLIEAERFIRLLRHLRETSKLAGFFNPDNIPLNGWVHPKWNPVGTATMRWSCSDPNEMQIPKCKCKPNCLGLNPECNGARMVVVPDHEDCEMMTADLSQAEVVGFLYAAQEWPTLDKVLNGGLDAHFIMASALDYDDPKNTGRKKAKTSTFAYVYGEAPKTTAMRTGMPLDDVLAMRREYAKTFPGVTPFRRMYIDQAINTGKVTSFFGISRYIRVVDAYGRAANQAANAPIQNIPPMVIRRAMLNLHKALPKPARIFLNVHDELAVTYPRELRDRVATLVHEAITSPVPEMAAKEIGMGSGLRFNTDLQVGPNWAAVRDIDVVRKLEAEGADPWAEENNPWLLKHSQTSQRN